MLYNETLKIFISVAETGSFTKASEILFISPVAIMKQVNLFEKNLGFKLFDRTHKGVFLTETGRSIYDSAKFIIEYSDNAIKKAKSINTKQKYIIKIGTSILNPGKALLDMWYKISDEHSEFKINLVPFEDDNQNILDQIRAVGKKFDFIVGVCDSKTWLKYCNFYKLDEYGFAICCRKDNPLAKKKSLKFKDLKNQIIYNVKKGDSNINDKIRDELKKSYPTVDMKDAPFFYDINVFNKVEENNLILMIPSCWHYVHPALVTIPLKENYKLPFGVLFSKKISKHAKEFLEIIKKLK